MKAMGKTNLLRLWGLAGATLLLIGLVAGAEAAKDRPIDRTVAKLIKQLGDDSFKVREAAQKKLIEIGPPAMEQVAKAVKSKDAEVSRRAEEILKIIPKRAVRQNTEAIKKNLLWKLPLAKSAAGTMRVSPGVVCLQDEDGWLRAADVKTGRSIWSYRSDGGRCWTVSGDTVYVSDSDSKLHALDIRSGKPRRGFGSQTVFGKPAVWAGKMYVGGSKGELWVLDARTGKRLNTFKVSGPVDFAPILRAGKLYFLTRDGKAHALNLKTGKTEWSAPVATGSPNALALGDGRVYVRADKRLLALDAKTGKRKWAFPVGADGAAAVRAVVVGRGANVAVGGARVRPRAGISLDEKPLSLAGGALCLAAGSKILAVDAAKGKKLWEHSPADLSVKGGSQINADRVQVVVGGQVRVFVMKAAPGGGNVLINTHSFHSGGLSPPAVAGGVMYFGSAHGLHAVDLKTRRPLWTYPTEGHVTLRPVVAGGAIYFVGRPSPPVIGRRNVGIRADANRARKPTLYALKLKLPPARRAGR